MHMLHTAYQTVRSIQVASLTAARAQYRRHTSLQSASILGRTKICHKTG